MLQLLLLFNRGVNRGLFSNEAGQGSAPIAHAAAKADNPVSEGIVAILEPFIDTIIICFLTGMVLLSTGIWNEKLPNQFQYTDTIILDGLYNQNDSKQKTDLFEGLTRQNLPRFKGEIEVDNGLITNPVTILHARSIAENVKIYALAGNQELSPSGLFTGNLRVKNGKYDVEQKTDDGIKTIIFQGYSLVHSAPLTAEAFKRSFFGNFGEYIVTIGLLLFAFSTAIAWSYYGDRAITFLVGSKGVPYYRMLYIIGFFLASFVDTTIIWTFAGITIAVMTVPNLIGILFLHKDMKQSVKKYWDTFRQ